MRLNNFCIFCKRAQNGSISTQYQPSDGLMVWQWSLANRLGHFGQQISDNYHSSRPQTRYTFICLYINPLCLCIMMLSHGIYKNIFRSVWSVCILVPAAASPGITLVISIITLDKLLIKQENHISAFLSSGPEFHE